MKILFAGLISIFSFSALACPVYNGTYACKGGGMDQTLHIKTEMVNGVAQYSMDETQVLADGVYRKVKFMGGIYDMAASCQAQTLIVNILLDGGDGDNADCGAQKWNLLYTLNWTPAGNNIAETHTSSTVCENGKTVPGDTKGKMTCIRQ